MTVTAEDMAKDMKEISVAEFFEKNRHLLGYENPAKALLTVVKEAVDNSLTWNVPVVIQENEGIKIRMIGEFIDEQFKKHAHLSIKKRGGHLENLSVFDDASTLCFNPKTQRLEFQKIGTLFRHKVNSDIYRISLESGRYIELTDYHSIFTLTDGCVVPMITSQLKIGDSVVVPRNVWDITSKEFEIDVIDKLLKLPENLTKNIGLYGIRNILDKELKLEIKNNLPKHKLYRLSNFRKCNRLPLNIVRKLSSENIQKLKSCKIGMKFCKYKTASKISINPALVEFLGIYVAEGSILSNLYKVYLSFGNMERDLIGYVRNLIKKVWGVEPAVNIAHKSATNIIMHSMTIAFILKYVLEVGRSAREKSIPPIIFGLPRKLRERFLIAYMAGDGHPADEIFRVLKGNEKFRQITSEKITVATVSKKLAIDLQYLLSSLGLAYSCGKSEAETRKIAGVDAKFSKSYTLYVYTNQAKSSINKVPISIIKNVSDHRLKYYVSKKNQKSVYIDTLLKLSNNGGVELKSHGEMFLDGDLGVLPIKKIEKINYDKKWVYDLSVPGYENFVAGSGPTVCHNSLDATCSAGIVPEIIISVKEMAPDRFRIIVEDNGPGVVKAKVPSAFAKFLFGSKFHKLRQSRGIFGIGIHGAVLYSQLTTGKSVKVTTGTGGRETEVFDLMMDIGRNEPHVISHQTLKNPDGWHGVKIEMEIEGSYSERHQSILEYLKQTAISNPYADIIFEGPTQKVKFKRTTSKMPKPPKEIKPHPYGVELGILRRMLISTNAKTITSFLKTDFSRVGKMSAQQICRLARIDEKQDPKTLSPEESERVHKAIQMVKLIAPPTNCISPMTDDLIIQGLKRELDAEFFVATTRSPTVYRGYPFQLEVGMAFGGNLDPNRPCRLYRFANKVPLLYNQGGCVITKAVKEVDWRRYGLRQSRGGPPIGPLAILVHFASVWIPFTSEGKQAIANYPEIMKEIKLALQDTGRKIAQFVRKKRKIRDRQIRKQLFERYIPEVAGALEKLTEKNKEKISSMLEDMVKSKTGVEELEKSEEKA